LSLSDDGDTLAVGMAYSHDDPGVTVYHFISDWTKQGSTLADAGDMLAGWSTALSADASIVALGSLSGEGEIGVYAWYGEDEDWLGILSIPAGIESSVAMSADGSVLVVGLTDVAEVYEYLLSPYPD
jgi:hypothetical protein